MPLTFRLFVKSTTLSPALLVTRRAIKEDMLRRISTGGEVVEDSEPERQERRRKDEEERSMKKNLKSMQQTIANSDQKMINAPQVSVIELSDDTSDGGVNPTWSALGMRNNIQNQLVTNSNTETKSVIDISDDDLVPSAEVPEACLVHQRKPADVSEKPIPNYGAPPNPPITVSSDSETEPEEENRMALNRFVYQNSSRSQSTASLSRTSSIVAPKKKPGCNAGQHRFAADFSNAELARLARCVCCRIGWTTRKGVAQKMVHVQSCAKKNAFTDETVKILIRQEVDKATAESQVADAKGKSKAINPENLHARAPKTHMEDVIQGPEPKRRGRRPEVPTLKNGMETRDENLDRARVILGNHTLPNTRDNGFQTQQFGPSRLIDRLGRDPGSWDVNPATQAFGESELRKRQALSVVLGATTRKHSISDVEPASFNEGIMPPSTQNFGPSKLVGLGRISSSSAFDVQHDIDSAPLSHLQPVVSFDSPLGSQSPKLASSPSYIDLVSLSSKDPSPRFLSRRNNKSDDYAEVRHSIPSHLRVSRSPRPPTFILPTNRQDAGGGSKDLHNVYEQSQQQLEDDFTWNNDDVFLHFDPHIGDQNQHKSTYITGDQPIYSDGSDNGQCTYIRPITAARRKYKTRKTTSLENVDASLTTKKATREKSTQDKGKQRAAEHDDGFNEEWESRLKESIIRDKKLHLRILRYEPIHFEVFLQKVTDNGIPSNRVKRALRAFLDKQAINFHSAELTWGRGRR